MCACVGACMCVQACVYVIVCARACVYVCMRACVGECVRMCESVHIRKCVCVSRAGARSVSLRVNQATVTRSISHLWYDDRGAMIVMSTSTFILTASGFLPPVRTFICDLTCFGELLHEST